MSSDNAQSGGDIVRFDRSDRMTSIGKLGRSRMFFVHLLAEFSFFFFVSVSVSVCVKLSVRTREDSYVRVSEN